MLDSTIFPDLPLPLPKTLALGNYGAFNLCDALDFVLAEMTAHGDTLTQKCAARSRELVRLIHPATLNGNTLPGKAAPLILGVLNLGHMYQAEVVLKLCDGLPANGAEFVTIRQFRHYLSEAEDIFYRMIEESRPWATDSEN